MKIVHAKQIWKGWFMYPELEDVDYNPIPVSFGLEITVENDSFTGIATDEEAGHLFDEPIRVTGFFQDHIISFVKKYPCLYFSDETGNLTIDPTKNHPDIYYYGTIDSSKTQVNGTWEMVIQSIAIDDGDYLEQVHSGAFEMRRIL
ncbi:MAG: hypothetical protein RLZZ500_2229 [Bacteroidota bacterium]|jgi:hypothetical protein